MSLSRQPELPLTIDMLRGLMTSDRGAIIPHQVGKALRHHIPLWSRSGQEELRSILGAQIGELRERLHNEGLEPDRLSADSRIPKRLREEASSLAALITFHAPFVEGFENQLEQIDEGLGWARTAGDRLQEALLHLVRIWSQITANATDDILNDYRRGLEAAEQGDHLAMELYLRNALADWLLSVNDYDSAEVEARELLRSAENEPAGPDRSFHRSRGLRHLGAVERGRQNYPEAIGYLRQAMAEGDEEEDPIHVAAILFNLANIYHPLGNSAEAIELLLEMTEIGRRSRREVISANAFARIGEIHIDLGDVTRAGEAFELAERIVSNANLPHVLRTIRERKLPLYLHNDLVDEGIALGNELLEQRGRGIRAIPIIRNLGLLYERNGEMEQAESVLRSGLELDEIGPAQKLQLGVPLARALVSLRRNEEAEEILRSVCSTPPEIDRLRKTFARGRDLLASMAEEKGDYRSAVGLVREAAELRQQIERRENETSVTNARILADLRVRAREEELVGARRAQVETEMATVLTGLHGTHGTLRGIEGRLRENLSWLEPEEIERVIAALRQAIDDPVTISAIEEVADETSAIGALQGIDDPFFERLDRRFPGLTRRQQQLCAMIHAGLDTAQIATLLGITHNAVWTNRKRLRKKMNLGEGENLEGVIAEDEDRKEA